VPANIRLRSYQTGLRNTAAVDTIKAAMREGWFGFALEPARLDGFRDPWGVYYITDGNHRMVAALEIERETGDPWAVHALLEHGRWVAVEVAPAGHRPMPGRGWWGWLRNWIGV
jgi:filamentous hemagglutinin